MNIKKINYGSSSTTFYFSAGISFLKEIVDKDQAVIIIDENVFNQHKKKFKGWQTIVLKPGEQYKTQATVDTVIKKLLAFNADRNCTLIGVGGGVITDITGFAASVYMRGIKFGFVPTTLLSLVDASIGGKNGIDVGLYKNIVGTINQPAFILHDLNLLKTLPTREWQNGFAEIIKHACIKDAAMFKELEAYNLKKYQTEKDLLCNLIQRNAILKSKIASGDELETGNRKLLNFGHTFGHAIENLYQLPHGFAVAVGMVMACMISEKYMGFKETNRMIEIIRKYGLPVHQHYNAEKVIEIMKADKKKVKEVINYILLQRIGKSVVQPIEIKELESIIQQLGS